MARSRSRDMMTTSLSHVTLASADIGAEQSHYLEVMLRARIWPPVARHACRHHRAHLSCAWQPSALPPSFAPPSLHVLGSMSESCVPAAEDDVCRRDVSPYGCEDVISCLSTRQSRQRRSLTPYSARMQCVKNPYSVPCATCRAQLRENQALAHTQRHAHDPRIRGLIHMTCLITSWSVT